MAKYSTLLMGFVCLVFFSNAAMAQESYYNRQNGIRYRQAVSQATAASQNAQVVQNQINAQRVQFNQGMASKNSYTRSRAKQNFISYLTRLQRALLAAENAHNNAVGAGQTYARGLLQVNTTTPQGKQVAAQVQVLRSTFFNLKNTRNAVGREIKAARDRRN